MSAFGRQWMALFQGGSDKGAHPLRRGGRLIIRPVVCSSLLAALVSPERNVTGPLNYVCYMWWDEFPSIASAGDSDLPMLHDAALRTMERILLLSSLACQESALHGLGHWQHAAACM